MTFIDIKNSDCIKELQYIKDKSVHLVLTDPPYFLHKMDKDWDNKTIATTNSQRIKNLPSGMKFDPRQSVEFGLFFQKIASEFFRILVPGGFLISFSQPRLYQRMAVASEDAGFWIRDMLIWHYTKKTQAKAFSLDSWIDKRKISSDKKEKLKQKINGRKTPQLKNEFESIMLAQKPVENNFIDNYDIWETGLIDTSITLDNKFPSNVIKVEKPNEKEKVDHPTQKPICLLEFLIKIFTKEKQIVCDPFLGSGTTALACYNTKRSFMGFEKEQEYFLLAKRRLEEKMNKSKNRKQLCIEAQEFIKQSVFEVVCEQTECGGVGPKAISEVLGLYRKHPINDGITYAMLNELMDEGKVEKKEKEEGKYIKKTSAN